MPSIAQKLVLKKQAYGLRGVFKKITPQSLACDLGARLASLKKETDGHEWLLSGFFGPARNSKKIAQEKKACLALIRLGADLRVAPVMQNAFEAKNSDVLREIMKHSYALELPVNSKGDTLLTGLTENYYFELALDALKAGAKAGAQNNDGSTALGLICKTGSVTEWHKKLLGTLLTGTPDINHRDNEGRTALFIAGENFNKDIFSLLLQHGADPRIKNNKGLDIVESLKKRGWPGGQPCIDAVEKKEKEVYDSRQEVFNAAAKGMPAEQEIVAPDVKITKNKIKLRIVD
jgi:hypothetical protein